MANLSFARIMYGANEDFHASQPTSAPALSTLAAQPVPEDPARTNAASEPATLGELLQKAWATLRGKP